ncbi:MAG: MFS transporter, partial [bacterium]
FGHYQSSMIFAAYGMGTHMLLFPWLLVGVLEFDPDTVGFATMLVMLPTTLLLLVGGALSEGRDLGRFLRVLYWVIAVPYVLLFFGGLVSGWSWALVVLFGVLVNSINSFVQPAREAFLGQIAPSPLQSSIAKIAVIQSLGMAAGTLLGGAVVRFSLETAILLQTAVFIVAGIIIRFSSTGAVDTESIPRVTLKDIREGLRYVRTHAVLPGLMLHVGLTGLLGMGFYFVLLPLMTRNIYQAEAQFLSGLQVAFLLGGMTTSLAAMRWFKRFDRPGRVLTATSIARGILLGCVALRPPAELIFLLIYGWGITSGISTIVGRTLAQEISENTYRARVVSIYQLCLWGVGPIGALIGGLLMDSIGILQTAGVLGFLSFGFGLGFLLIKNALWDLDYRLK